MFKRLNLYFFCLILAIVFCLPSVTHASSATVEPAVMDRVAGPRDILKETLTFTNISGSWADFYVFVNNISPQNGEQSFADPSTADLSGSLANWIDISRAMMHLAPGQKQSLDFQIRVNLTAKPGIYHAKIAIADGSGRDDAGSRLETAGSLTVNLQVPEDIKQGAQLTNYSPSRSIFFSMPARFSFVVQNTGNRDMQPSGEIIIYNRGGEETGSVKINEQGSSIKAGDSRQFEAAWSAPNALGRYKAVLNVNYGGGEQQTLQDSAGFWVLPWQAVLFGGIILFCLFILIIVFSNSRHKKNLRDWEKIAAGPQPVVIKIPPMNISPREDVPGSMNRKRVKR